MSITAIEQASNVMQQLVALERELRRQGLWAQSAPPPSAFDSVQPFCIDTMSFIAWLQFVLIPRMSQCVASGEALPSASGIAPMAEEALQLPLSSRVSVITILERLDSLLSH